VPRRMRKPFPAWATVQGIVTARRVIEAVRRAFTAAVSVIEKHGAIALGRIDGPA
jgi:hypothetical protein